MKSTKSQIEENCNLIQRAIHLVKGNTILLKNFPYGCCRDSSIILGKYFSDNGYSCINYCWNQFEDNCKSHAWLEIDNLILDITADQFGEKYRNKYVFDIIDRFPIHKNFQKEIFNLSIGCTDLPDILSDYNIIVRSIK